MKPISIILALLLIPVALAIPGDTNNDGAVSREELGLFIVKWMNNEISREELGHAIQSWVEGPIEGYTFLYPADKESGYYNVPCEYAPPDECDECDSFGTFNCNIHDDTRELYTINEGYTEDFTYTSQYPIYSAWEIRNFDDFSEKCFVGDCNKLNKRLVLCIDGNNIPTIEVYDCDKWTNPNNDINSKSQWCINGKEFNLIQPIAGVFEPGGFTQTSCSKPTIINFYYAYNEYAGYEGYDSTWESRWQGVIDNINNMLATYNIHLTPSFIEYKIPDDSAIPAVLLYDVSKMGVYQEGDIQVTILAGKENPMDYGFACDYYTGIDGNLVNPCSMNSAIRAGDYRYFVGEDYITESLLHEIGHKAGCPHTGDKGSFAGHLYSHDIMSYGKTESDFLYECRIAMWYLGEN